MTNYNIDLDLNLDSNLLLDFDSFSAEGIELEPEQVDRAVELSDILADPERQWRTYLNSLALFGFINWLELRESSLSIDAAECSVMQPHYANYIDGVFNLTVGAFKICLLTNGAVIDEFINIDRSLIDLPAYVAHFYILVDLIEEQSEVKIDRFISYEEITSRQHTSSVTESEDWTYELPVAWFNSQLDDLLLQLRCLEPQPLPEANIATNPTELESLVPQLISTNNLQEVLTRSQAESILGNPDLLLWLYELQTTQPTVADALTSLGNRLATTVSQVAQTAINIKSWLNNELDELAQNLAWTLLPSPVFPSGLRDLQVVNRQSPAEEFEAIITQLRVSGEDIPAEARGACQDFNLTHYELRLFAITWVIEETPGIAEWSLMLILGAKPNHYLPQGLRLELKEGDTVLDEKTVSEDTADSYIYTQVIGELDEQFTTSVILSNGETVTFPNFAFN